MRTFLIRLASALAAGAFAPVTLPAQEAPRPIFGDIVEVRVVNLEVVVEDGDGQRVRGLPPTAFRLRVDGEETPIDFFSEIVDGRAVRDAPGATDAGPTPVGTSYLLFLDEYSSTRVDLDAAIEGIAESIARLGPEDRMAIVAFDGEKLDLVSNWSRSSADLQRALRRARDRKSHGLMTSTLLQRVAVAAEYEEYIDRMVVAASSTLRSFGDPPGRKVMLMTSGGWPTLASEKLLGPRYYFDYARGHRYLEKVYETANLLGYTVYPIDTSRHELAGPAGREARPANPSVESDADAFRGTLRILATTTGGEVVARSSRRDALDRVIDDTRSYYWLGFTPAWRGDNESHEIDVELLEPGLRVRHRAGFEDMSRSKEVDFVVEGALMLGHLPGSEPLNVEVGEPRRERRKTLVPLEITIPLDAVTVLPIDGSYVTQLELRLAAVDATGGRSELDVIPIELRGSRPPSPGQTGSQQVTARVRSKTQSLVVSLHDPPSGTILASVVEIAPSR